MPLNKGIPWGVILSMNHHIFILETRCAKERLHVCVSELFEHICVLELFEHKPSTSTTPYKLKVQRVTNNQNPLASLQH